MSDTDSIDANYREWFGRKPTVLKGQIDLVAEIEQATEPTPPPTARPLTVKEMVARKLKEDR